MDAARAHIAFRKVEGLGNDFLVVEAGPDGVARWSDGAPLAQEDVARLCDRRRGVGGDGVLVVRALGGASGGDRAPVASMQVCNADGTEPEMCGNGLRCVALHLALAAAEGGGEVRGAAPVAAGDGAPGQAAPGQAASAGAGPPGAPVRADAPFVVDTGAGPHQARLRSLDARARTAVVEIDMRVPSLVPAEVPVRPPAGSSGGPLLDVPFDVDGRALRLSAVSMGNPHAVTFDVTERAEMAALGPRLEGDARFPARVNVGFARLRADGGLDLDVYERGVGWTDACGTGACAAVVAAVETGRVRRGAEVDVHLPGGVLTVRVGAPGERVRMTGPAREVFRGVALREATRAASTAPRRPRVAEGA